MGSPELTVAVPALGRDGDPPPEPSAKTQAGWVDWVVGAVQSLARLILAMTACMIAASVIPVVFGWRPYVVLSGSMRPAVQVGDVVIAAPAHPGDLIPGRVAVFPEPGRPGRLIVHRIHGVRPDGTLITKGDANKIADSTPLSPSVVRGLVRLRLPLIALPAHWWQTRDWLPAAVTVLILLILMAIAYPSGGPEDAEDEELTDDGTAEGVTDDVAAEAVTDDVAAEELRDDGGAEAVTDGAAPEALTDDATDDDAVTDDAVTDDAVTDDAAPKALIDAAVDPQ